MHFYLSIGLGKSSAELSDINIVSGGIPADMPENTIITTDIKPHDTITKITYNDVTALFLGDAITAGVPHDRLEALVGRRQTSELIKTVSGHYRLVILDRKSGEFEITSSLFSILPVFYHQRKKLLISDDLEWLSRQSNERQVNRKFIIESILFYYPLFNETIYNNIKLLPAHTSLIISKVKNVGLSKHTDISDWFDDARQQHKKGADALSDLFIDRIRHYLPEEPYVHALTGGFDSRTLVACALHHKKIFSTYGFGNDKADDISIASMLASNAGIEFNHVVLNADYIRYHSLTNGLEFIQNASGFAGFARAHYLYATKMISKGSRVVVTGNFGSEIFRAAHNAGAVISPNLYHLFKASSPEQAIQMIEQSPEFALLSADHVKKDWHQIADQLHTIKDFSRNLAGKDLNRCFYTFVFEEVFRKYFGPEMVNQYRYINNRTPFLDAEFLQALMPTEMAGVHSDFFEHNPVKRFKGQVLYAHILKKTYRPFYVMKTGKGYRPSDLTSIAGKIRIAASYFSKKTISRSEETDPNAVSESYRHNINYFKTMPISGEFFNAARIHQLIDQGYCEHEFLIALSQAWLVNRATRAWQPEPAMSESGYTLPEM